MRCAGCRCRRNNFSRHRASCRAMAASDLTNGSKPRATHWLVGTRLPPSAALHFGFSVRPQETKSFSKGGSASHIQRTSHREEERLLSSFGNWWSHKSIKPRGGNHRGHAEDLLVRVSPNIARWCPLAVPADPPTAGVACLPFAARAASSSARGASCPSLG